MTSRITKAVVLVVLLMLGASDIYAQDAGDVPTSPQNEERDKRAQTGMKFITLSVNPRAAALGDAVTALQDFGAASMFYNPAGLAYMQQGWGGLSLGQAQWLADITYNQAGLALRPANGQYGVIGFHWRSVDYGEFERTRRAGNESGYVTMDPIEPSATAVGVSYAQQLSTRFSVGGSVSYVNQDLGTGSIDMNEDGDVVSENFSASTAAFDFGIMYQPGFRSLNFAMSARNFSPAVNFVEEDFELPLTLSVGVSMDVLDFAGQQLSDMHSLLVSADMAHPRDYDETIDLGGEYTFMDIFSLRAGYTFPSDVAGLNLGGGINYEFGGVAVGVNYSYTQFDIFDDVNRFGIHLGF